MPTDGLWFNFSRTKTIIEKFIKWKTLTNTHSWISYKVKFSEFKPVTTERALQASLFFNRANMHLACCLCMHFVMISPSLFSSQLLGEIRSNKIALAAWIRLNPIPDGIVKVALFLQFGHSKPKPWNCQKHPKFWGKISQKIPYSNDLGANIKHFFW